LLEDALLAQSPLELPLTLITYTTAGPLAINAQGWPDSVEAMLPLGFAQWWAGAEPSLADLTFHTSLFSVGPAGPTRLFESPAPGCYRRGRAGYVGIGPTGAMRASYPQDPKGNQNRVF
jgi:hypothetical protein